MQDMLWIGLILLLLVASLGYAALCERAWGAASWPSTSGSPGSPPSPFSFIWSPCLRGPNAF